MSKSSESNRWFNISATSSNAMHADIYLYGIIGGWRVNIRTFMDDLRQYKNLKTINVFISTPGGSFMDGLPIYQTLRQHKATVSTINMGYAVSMGSVIMMAAKPENRKMGHNCLLMIHSPNVMLWDNMNARELRKEADVLDTHEAAMLPRYQECMNLSADEVRTLLHHETWYTAEQAKAAGLIGEITDPVDLSDIDDHTTEDHWRETAAQMRLEPPADFLQHLNRHVPDARNILNFSERTPLKLPTGQGTEPNEDDVMTPEQMTELKGHFDTAIANAAEKGAAQALEGVDARINTVVQQVTAAQGEQLTAAQETLTNVAGNIDTALTTLNTLAAKQPEMADTLKGVADVLDEVKNLPVNTGGTNNVNHHGNEGTNGAEAPRM